MTVNLRTGNFCMAAFSMFNSGLHLTSGDYTESAGWFCSALGWFVAALNYTPIQEPSE